MIRWIVVGDSSRCRLFSQDKRFGGLRPIDDLAHTASRLTNGDLIRDRPGRSFDSAGTGRHAMEPATEPLDEEALRFARQITERLDRARKNDEFEGLVLIAAPRFLGRLRRCLKRPLRDKVVSEIPANLGQASEEAILAKLSELFV